MIQAVRGMPDILPDQAELYREIETVLIACAQSLSYREIRLPLIEQVELIARSVGESSDIVSKEMFQFQDKSGKELVLRPEATAGCQRAVSEHSLAFNQPCRLWYLGPMFRYERPQKGRTRQFHQFGIEAYNMPGIDIELEQILATFTMWQQLGIVPHSELRINSLGDAEDRQKYNEIFKDWLQPRVDKLDEESRRRISTNIMRIWDSKSPSTQELLVDAPRLVDVLSDHSQQRFTKLVDALRKADVPVLVDHSLVRGLDYYSDTVFEWTSSALGAQDAFCGGGRYDKLSTHLGFKRMPAVGWALGIERLALCVQHARSDTEKAASQVDIYLASVADDADDAVRLELALLARDIVTELPHLRVETHLTTGGMSAQMKRAAKIGASVVVILGPDEIATDTLGVKRLSDGNETRIQRSDVHKLEQLLNA